jgi:hypothetical protein
MVCVTQLPHTQNTDELNYNLHHLVSLSSYNVMTLPSEVLDQFLKHVCSIVRGGPSH